MSVHIRSLPMAVALTLAAWTPIANAEQVAPGKTPAKAPAARATTPPANAAKAAPKAAPPSAPTAAPAPAPAKTAPAKTAAAAPARAESAADVAKKKEILASARWRRAMFEFNEWLTNQPIYTPPEVAQIKQDLSAKVGKMNARELESMLDDMDAKFKILESKPAQEAGSWLAQYLSILSDSKREEVLKELPNIATTSAAQLSQEITKIQRKRQSMIRAQSTFDQTRQAQVDAAMQANQQAQAAIRRDQQLGMSESYTSPYRPPSTRERPFEDVKAPGPSMNMYVSPWGGVGYIFGN